MFRQSGIACLLAVGAAIAGCQKPMHFPAASTADIAANLNATGAYDTDRDGRSDYFTFAGASGRIERIGYDRDLDQRPDELVSLDLIPFGQCRHLVIILDGFGYDMVRSYYDAGGLRLFHPPSRVIAPYPTLTDPCIEDILGSVRCRSLEARYFDRRTNRLAGGAGAYLRGQNAPYNRLLNYRADMIWDAIGYVYPRQVFGKEINDVARLFEKAETQELLAYLVSSAGVSTASAAEGQRTCLALVERLIHQAIRQTHGLTKVTLLSDHGHSYTPARRIPLESYLKGKGWRLTDSLRRPKDVAHVRFGLETYASFATRRPADLAADLVGCEGVALASYVAGDKVIVLSPGGRAAIRRKGNAYKYAPSHGDPLKLAALLRRLPADSAGYRDADRLLAATAGHLYPAPLQRLWRAHFGLVENPPDVIISLEDAWFSGLGSFAGSVKVASTHGSLNSRTSTTFIMSTIGPLPPLMRSGDIPANMAKLIGQPWPMRK